jgi:methyl-accepting chemotaxis protein
MEPITNNAFAIDLGAEHSVRLQRTGERSERLVSRTKKMPRCLCGRETGECLSEIVVEGQDIDRKIGAAVDSAREQAAGLNEINETLINRNQGTQKNAAMVEESTAASHGLAREVSALNMLLATFKTGATRQEISSAPVVAAQATPPMSANRVKPQKVNRAFASQGNAAIAQSTDNWEEF